MFLAICAGAFVWGLRRIYQQGWDQGYSDHLTGAEEPKLWYALAHVPILGWVYDMGYDKGFDAYGSDFDLLRPKPGEFCRSADAHEAKNFIALVKDRNEHGVRSLFNHLPHTFWGKVTKQLGEADLDWLEEIACT